MIFSKKINIIVYSLVFIGAVVAAVMIYRINMIYPAADVVTNEENGYVEWYGCEIRALEYDVYSYDEFKEAYPDNKTFSYIEEEGRYTQDYIDSVGIVVMNVNVKNVTDSSVYFVLPQHAEVVTEPLVWFNGASPMSTDNPQESVAALAPGEDKDLVCLGFFADGLVYPTKLDKMKSYEYKLVFSFYPKRIELIFN